MANFELETNEEKINALCEQDVIMALENIDSAPKDGLFCILSKGKNEYIQTLFDNDVKVWRLEYRETSKDGYKHFFASPSNDLANKFVSFDDVKKAFTAYFLKQANWPKSIKWQRYYI